MDWLKQTEKPLFPEILWSRPENRLGAGKLLIIGGNGHAIAAPATAYQYAIEAGIGSSRVIMPDHVKKAFGRIVQEAYFAPSNPSGGFAMKAMDELLVHTAWADGVLLAGDFGHNSESSALLESYIFKTSALMTLTHDAVEASYNFTPALLDRQNTTLVLSFAQAQKIFSLAHGKTALKYSMSLLQLVEAVQQFSESIMATLLIRHNETVLLARASRVVSTKATDEKVWRVEAAAKASVWWLQNPTKSLEATTTALLIKNN